MKLCLGTAQLGMSYGVNNKSGQPSLEEAIAIIDKAVKDGIRSFDVSSLYGSAEEVLGIYQKEIGFPIDTEIISKLRPILNNEDDYYNIIRSEVEKTLTCLNVDKIYGYLLHSQNNVNNPRIIEALKRIKQDNLINNYGVSIYDISYGLKALEHDDLQLIQLPYNLFDQRGDTTGFFLKAKQRQVVIYSRSPLLQGLLLIKIEDVPKRLYFTIPYIKKVIQLADDYLLSQYSLAIKFVKQNYLIDYMVFGIDTKEQLSEFINVMNDTTPLPDECNNRAKELFTACPPDVFLPTLWHSEV